MKKIPNKTKIKKNAVVEVLLMGGDNIKYKREKYKCIGVLMREDENMIRVAFNAIDNCLASVTVKLPCITAFPDGIASLTRGAEIIPLSKNIATVLPIFLPVISANILAPASSNSMETSGLPVLELNSTSDFFRFLYSM